MTYLSSTRFIVYPGDRPGLKPVKKGEIERIE